jgi:hypothetical protein
MLVPELQSQGGLRKSNVCGIFYAKFSVVTVLAALLDAQLEFSWLHNLQTPAKLC